MGHYAKMLHLRFRRIYTVMSALRRALDRYIRHNLDTHERLTMWLYWITGYPCPPCVLTRIIVLVTAVIAYLILRA